MNPDDLIRMARHLANGGAGASSGRPSQADLRRAVSTAYYALFHALASNCADMLIGSTPSRRSQQAWRQTYRSPEHRFIKNQCNRNEISRFPPQIRNFASAFVELQNRRHTADYDPLPDPGATFYRSDVLTLVADAERAINLFNSAGEAHRRAFAAYVLFPLRNP